MNQLEQTLKTINNKIFFVGLMFTMAMVIVCARLYYLQIYLSDEFFNLSKKNYTRVKSISSPRGNIVDCQNRLLATNRPVIDVYWEGSGNRNLNSEQLNNLKKLCDILNINLNIEFQKNIAVHERFSKPFSIASDISFDELSKLSEVFSSDKNIKILSSFKRFYPHNVIACHVLGYLSQESIEYIGKMGLEHIFENILKGQKGRVVSTIDSMGKRISQEEIMQAISGHNIQTCLDLELQILCEQSFPEDFSGCIMMMDPIEGDVKALVSRPNFDPNIFLKSISYDEWQIMQKEKPFINRACNATYPPASIFKLVSLAAGFEEKIIDESSACSCFGNMLFAGRKYHCSNKQGHGSLTIKEAFAKSCNILFFDMAKKIKINTLAGYAKKFGLGQKTGIILNEKEGLVPSNEWKLKKLGERWWPGETLSAIIGQSYTLVTPIQLARMMGAVFTGNLVKPRILSSEEILIQELGVSAATLKILQQLLKKVVKTGGSAARLDSINEDIEIYGKTGTAQTSDLEKRDLGKEYLEHAWFVSYFQYKNERPITMVVMVENAGSSAPAVAVSKRVIIGYRKIMRSRLC